MEQPETTYHVRMSEDKLNDLALQINDALDAYNRSMRSFWDKILQWRRQYDGDVPQHKNFPFPGSSCLHIPATKSAIDAIQARATKTIFSVTPYWVVAGRSPEDQESAPLVEQYLDYVAQSLINLPIISGDLYRKAMVDGTSIAKVTWVEDFRYVEREVVQITEAVGVMSLNGVELPALQETNVTPRTVKEKEYSYKGPAVRVVDILDFVLLPATATDYGNAFGVGDRMWLRFDQLKRGESQGVYFGVDALREASPDDIRDLTASARMNVDLIATDSLQQSEISRLYEIYELMWRMDLDEDGLEEWALITYSNQAKRIIRIDKYPYMHGRVCYVPYRCKPRDNSFWGISIAEETCALQAEMNALHNQFVDSGTLANASLVFARRQSGTDMDRLEYSPGKIQYVDDPSDITITQFQPPSPALLQAMQLIRADFERLTGVSDISLARPPSVSRTATEISSIVFEGNIKFDQIINRFQQSNVELAHQIIELSHQFVDDEYAFRILGAQQNPFQTIRKQDFGKRYDYIPHGSSITANKDIEKNRRMAVAQHVAMFYNTLQQYIGAASQNPNFWDLVEAIVSNLWYTERWVLESNDVRNPEEFIGRREDMLALLRQARNQQIGQIIQAQAGVMAQAQAQQAAIPLARQMAGQAIQQAMAQQAQQAQQAPPPPQGMVMPYG